MYRTPLLISLCALFLFPLIGFGQESTIEAASDTSSWAKYRHRVFVKFWDNPALTGGDGKNNINEQFSSRFNTHFQYDLAYDWRLKEKSKLALGVALQHSTSGSFHREVFPWRGPLVKNYWQFTGSYKIEKGAHLIRPGISIAYSMIQMDWEQFTFNDMIDPRYGLIYDSQETMVNSTNGSLDLNLAAEYLYKSFYFEAVIKHVTQPNIGLVGGFDAARMPSMLLLHSGIRLRLSDKILLSPFMIFERYELISSWTPGFISELGPRVLLGFSYNSLNTITLNTAVMISKYIRLQASLGLPTDPYLNAMSRFGYVKGGITYFINERKGG